MAKRRYSRGTNRRLHLKCWDRSRNPVDEGLEKEQTSRAKSIYMQRPWKGPG